jgi:hypothetical protein
MLLAESVPDRGSSVATRGPDNPAVNDDKPLPFACVPDTNLLANAPATPVSNVDHTTAIRAHTTTPPPPLDEHLDRSTGCLQDLENTTLERR